MLTVYKYRLEPPITAHLMPLDAKVLGVMWQPGPDAAFVYALVDTDYRKEQRHFLTVGTGFDVNEYLPADAELGPHIDSFAIPSTIVVPTMFFHVFEFLPFVP